MSDNASPAGPSRPALTGLPYIVGRDREGHWIACDAGGRQGGWFVSQQAAMDYARFETNWRPGAVQLASATLALQFR